MRLPALIILAGALLCAAGLLSKPLYERFNRTDVLAMSERIGTAARDARAAVDRDRKALTAAKVGLACLAGSAQCPGGARNPFGR